jgi:hypothetical protein
MEPNVRKIGIQKLDNLFLLSLQKYVLHDLLLRVPKFI